MKQEPEVFLSNLCMTRLEDLDNKLVDLQRILVEILNERSKQKLINQLNA